MAARRKVSGATLTWLVLLVIALVTLDREYPLATRGTVVAIVVVAIGAYVLREVRAATRVTALAELERDVAVTDDMTGPEFERFVARLMRASGMTGVKVGGGAGDMGADIIGTTGDGRRIVVQCKRYKANVGSPHIQRFAGTAFTIHHADVAVLVATSGFTPQARTVAGICRITLVDRVALSRWARTWTLPELTHHRRLR